MFELFRRRQLEENAKEYVGHFEAMAERVEDSHRGIVALVGEHNDRIHEADQLVGRALCRLGAIAGRMIRLRDESDALVDSVSDSE